MSDYSTVRIDKESKEKLEELAEQLSESLGIRVSLAAALKLIIKQEYDSSILNPRNILDQPEQHDTTRR